MKNIFKVFVIITLVAVIGFTMTACDDDGNTPTNCTCVDNGNGGNTTANCTCDNDGNVGNTIVNCTCDDNGSGGNGSNGSNNINNTPNNIDELAVWLTKQPANAISAPYTVKLKVNDLTDFEALRTTLNSAGRYVYLDFSDSPLTIIPDGAFFGNKNPRGCIPLTGITIPDSVTSIGQQAFFGFKSLASITIGSGVTSIGQQAFYGCTSLASVIIGSGVTSIGDSAFSVCTSLASVTFQGTITNFSGAFDGDLRAKYSAGGIGTYKTTAPVGDSPVWTKQ